MSLASDAAVDQYDDLLPVDLGEPARNRRPLARAAAQDLHRAADERRQKTLVALEHTEAARLAGQHDLVHGVGEGLAFRCHDDELERHSMSLL